MTETFNISTEGFKYQSYSPKDISLIGSSTNNQLNSFTTSSYIEYITYTLDYNLLDIESNN